MFAKIRKINFGTKIQIVVKNQKNQFWQENSNSCKKLEKFNFGTFNISQGEKIR